MLIDCRENETILEQCQQQGILVEGVCGGNGICGKCKVKVLEGLVPVTDKDRAFFNKEELEEGYRLACRAVPETKCVVSIDEKEKAMSILTQIPAATLENVSPKEAYAEEKENVSACDEARIAVDIGTTTVVMQLINDVPQDGFSDSALHSGTYAKVNPQRSFGADVLSRIQASVDGNGKELKEKILGLISDGVRELLFADAKIQGKERNISHIVIAANTTMIHLLMGYSCETLGVAPFIPITTEAIYLGADNFFEGYLDEDLKCRLAQCEICILPGISAFVGGDIIAGLYQTEFIQSAKTQLFIDIGTNGEMVIGNRERLFVASAAAGPAFEGGNIACGVASVPGAICGVEYVGESDRTANLGTLDVSECKPGVTWKLQTIGDCAPVGICGTGVVEMIYELLKAGRIDETGLLDEGETEQIVLCKEKNIFLTQKDIRAFQMAKAAICAGVETLMETYGVKAEEIERVYVAGGFGYYMNSEKAAAIGLFPNALKDKVISIGNSALAGAEKFAKYAGTRMEVGAKEELESIKGMAKEVSLAGNTFFEERYLQNMYFEKQIH